LSSRLYEILRGIEKGIIYTLNEPGAKKIPWEDILNLAWKQFKILFKFEIYVAAVVGAVAGIIIAFFYLFYIYTSISHWTGYGFSDFFSWIKTIFIEKIYENTTIEEKKSNAIQIKINLIGKSKKK
jgi:hypothetical protein